WHDANWIRTSIQPELLLKQSPPKYKLNKSKEIYEVSSFSPLLAHRFTIGYVARSRVVKGISLKYENNVFDQKHLYKISIESLYNTTIGYLHSANYSLNTFFINALMIKIKKTLSTEVKRVLNRKYINVLRNIQIYSEYIE